MRDKLFLYDEVTGALSSRRREIQERRSDVKAFITVGFEVLTALLMKMESSGKLHRVDW
jgi:hypothetical protein